MSESVKLVEKILNRGKLRLVVKDKNEEEYMKEILEIPKDQTLEYYLNNCTIRRADECLSETFSRCVNIFLVM